MAMDEALHTGDDIDICSKKGERGLANIEDCIEAKIQELKKNTKKSKEIMISAASNGNANKRANR